jgi:hypothetical protein
MSLAASLVWRDTHSRNLARAGSWCPFLELFRTWRQKKEGDYSPSKRRVLGRNSESQITPPCALARQRALDSGVSVRTQDSKPWLMFRRGALSSKSLILRLSACASLHSTSAPVCFMAPDS